MAVASNQFARYCDLGTRRIPDLTERFGAKVELGIGASTAFAPKSTGNLIADQLVISSVI